MKFGQLIEYNMRNIFVEKSYTKCGGETVPRPFSKKSKLSIFLDQYTISEFARLLCFPAEIFPRWCKLDFGPW